MRERLIELLMSNSCHEKECPDVQCDECPHIAIFEGDAEKIADLLLADGWMRPPCKEGTVVYFVARNSGRPIGTIDEIEIVQIARRKEGFHAKGRFKGNLNEFEIRAFKIDNYSFFLTREEAEAALVNYKSSKNEKGGAE